MAAKPSIAVIGVGNIGSTVAKNLVKGGRSVIVADKNIQLAKDLASSLGASASAMEVTDAIKTADIVVLAVWFNTIQELFVTFKETLKGKTVIDPSNPIAPDENGGFKKIIGEKESAGVILSNLLPAGAVYAKAFGSLGAATLGSAAFQQPERAVLFYATDDSNAAAAVRELISDAGFEPMSIGGVDQSIRMEVFGDLHEYGALGSAVNAATARTKV